MIASQHDQQREEDAPALPSMDDHQERVLAPRARHARRRAMLAIGGITALLVLLWFGDALSGLVPHGAFHPTTRQAGAYHVTLAIAPTQPKAGAPLHATLRVSDAANRPLTGASITYAWAMVSMDMGTTRGTAQASSPGTYNATITGLMGGYWRLTARIHSPSASDATVSFDIPIQG